MAEDDQDLELDVEDGDGESEGGGSKKLIIIIAAVVLLLGGGAAAYFLLGDDSGATQEETSEEAPEVKLPAIYVSVPNALTANLPGEKRGRTVQVKLNFLVRTSEAKQNVKQHLPQLRNDILMLLSQKNSEDLKKPEGRQVLQEEALQTVQATLTELVGDPTVEKVLFTSFVMQ
jgi:flagellar FliL protein